MPLYSLKSVINPSLTSLSRFDQVWKVPRGVVTSLFVYHNPAKGFVDNDVFSTIYTVEVGLCIKRDVMYCRQFIHRPKALLRNEILPHLTPPRPLFPSEILDARVTRALLSTLATRWTAHWVGLRPTTSRKNLHATWAWISSTTAACGNTYN